MPLLLVQGGSMYKVPDIDINWAAGVATVMAHQPAVHLINAKQNLSHDHMANIVQYREHFLGNIEE